MPIEIPKAVEKKILGAINLLETEEDFRTAFDLHLSSPLDPEIIKKLQKLRSGGEDVQSLEQVSELLGNDETALQLLAEGFGTTEPEDVLDSIGYEVTDSVSFISNDGGQVRSVQALVNPKDFVFPEIEEPDKEIPTQFPYRIVQSRPRRSRTTRLGGCTKTRRVQFHVVRGPMQTKDIPMLSIIIVEPTGSSGGTSMGTSIASADAIFSTYYVVQYRICVRYRWELSAIARWTHITEVCPPPRGTTDKEEVKFVSGLRWAELPTVFPFPCGRTVLYTTGATADSYNQAVRMADRLARDRGLERGIAPFVDHP